MSGIVCRVTIGLNSPEFADVQRLTLFGESSNKAAHRMIARYCQIMHMTTASPANVVADLLEVVRNSRTGMPGLIEYPPVEHTIKMIKNSTIEEAKRAKLVDYISSISFAEYAKLIEAVVTLQRT